MSALTISFDLSGENLQSVVNETTNNLNVCLDASSQIDSRCTRTILQQLIFSLPNSFETMMNVCVHIFYIIIGIGC